MCSDFADEMPYIQWPHAVHTSAHSVITVTDHKAGPCPRAPAGSTHSTLRYFGTRSAWRAYQWQRSSLQPSLAHSVAPRGIGGRMRFEQALSHLCRKQAGSAGGQLALGWHLSVADYSSGCPKLVECINRLGHTGLGLGFDRVRHSSCSGPKSLKRTRTRQCLFGWRGSGGGSRPRASAPRSRVCCGGTYASHTLFTATFSTTSDSTCGGTLGATSPSSKWTR